MSTGSTIEWTDATWSPTTGCDRVSPGCDNCYALTLAKRLKAMGSAKYQRDGNLHTSGPGFGLTMHEGALALPLHWREPKKVFVNSMSDLFHPEVPDDFIAQVWIVMALAERHTFQVLTKRHGRMRALLTSGERWTALLAEAFDFITNEVQAPVDPGQWDRVRDWVFSFERLVDEPREPFGNVLSGVSVEDQKRADLRVPALIDTPGPRFLSCEPLLGPVTLDRYLWLDGGSTAGPFYDHAGRYRGGGGIGGQTLTRTPSHDLSWVIVGGESGTGARPMHPDWVRSLRDQCVAANVPFFFKQWGGRTPKAGGRELDGHTWDEFPVLPGHRPPRRIERKRNDRT